MSDGTAAMQRMRDLDWLFLGVENKVSHMHLGAVGVFEGPPPRFHELAGVVAMKLPALARYRQRVRFVPFDLGRPLWVTDPGFDLGYHLRHTALPRPGGDTQLRRLVARVMSIPLDRSRPLWEMWLIGGLAHDRWGLLCKLHHCMVDGVAAGDLLAVLLELEPCKPDPLDDEWLPAPAPSTASVIAHGVRDQALNPLQHGRSAMTLARHPRHVARGVAAVANGVASIARPQTSAAGSLNRALSRQRQWAVARASLKDVKTIKNSMGGTVNDVVLACACGAFRELLGRRGQPLPVTLTVRTLVPVSVRTSDALGVFDNRVSALFAALPVGLEDPIERLHAITAGLDASKRSGQVLAGVKLTQVAGLCPAPLLSLGTRALARVPQRQVQTVTTNIPGPQSPVYLCQRRMLEIFPYVPLALDVPLGIAICSYDGGVRFGITGDGDGDRDVQILAHGIMHALRELLEHAKPKPPRPPTRRSPSSASTPRRPAHRSGSAQTARGLPASRS
jgi:diacylglycerol O-acyltransferase / wax synthase